MKTLFQKLDYGGKPYLWTYRTRSEQDFDGYYHWHQGFEMLFVLEGQGSVIVNQQTYELRPGMLFFFPPYQLHKVYAEVSPSRPYERCVFHFVPSYMESYLNAFPSLRDMFKRMQKGLIRDQAVDLRDNREDVQAACLAFNKYRGGLSAAAEEEQAAMLLLKLLSSVRQAGLTDDSRAGEQPLRHSERIMAWIERHYREPFELDKLADELHMSKSYLSRLFRQETGSSITGYLTARRIQQACSLLQTSDQTVELIGEQVGLGNVSYFIQLFKRVMGVSPHQYRLKL